MCTVKDGTAQLCPWGRRYKTREQVLLHLLTTRLSATEIETELRRSVSGVRATAVYVRRLRVQAESQGCLPPRSKTCPGCPPEKPTLTMRGGRCSPCQERHHPEDQRRYRQRAAACLPPRIKDILPPTPSQPLLFPLGTTWYASRPSTSVPPPVVQLREFSPRREPSFQRARCEVDAWSRPSSTMEAA